MQADLKSTLHNLVEQLPESEWPAALRFLEFLCREGDLDPLTPEDRLDALLQQGLDSGPSSEMTAADWEGIRREVHRRHAERHSG